MNGKIIFMICVFSLFGTQIVFGQDARTRKINEDDFNRRREALEYLKQMPRERKPEKSKRLSKEEIKRFKDTIAVSEEDLDDYKNFLKQKDTGIFRLLPNFNCESGKTISLVGDCKNFVPGTWTYSFRREDYSDLYFNDISFRQGFLSPRAS